MCDKDAEKDQQYSKERLIDNIVQNYSQLEQSIVNQLYMANELHGITAGGAREDIWRQMFETIVPKKFVIESSVFIIDSKFYKDSDKTDEGVSKEVDLAIIDETYTPYIFRYGKLKFVPIEAVAAVIECKSQSSKEDDLRKWVDKIDDLKTSLGGITRVLSNVVIGDGLPSQQATRPLKIFCRLVSSKSSHPRKEFLKKSFDFILTAYDKKASKKAKITIETGNKNSNLSDWHQYLNSPKPREPQPWIKITDIVTDKEDRNEFNEKFGENILSLKFDYSEVRKQTDGELKGDKPKTLAEITLDDYKVLDSEKKDEISLLSFNFQLNQLLMIINNPMLFPHRAYVGMFNKEITPKPKKKRMVNKNGVK